MGGRTERVYLRRDGGLAATVQSGPDMADAVMLIIDLGHFGIHGQSMLRLDQDGARRLARALEAAADNAGPSLDAQLEDARRAASAPIGKQLADAAKKAAGDLGLKMPEDYIR